MRRQFTLYLVVIILTAAFLSVHSLSNPGGNDAAYVRGIVFNDENRNQIRDDGEKGVGQVCVSNGIQVVETDEDGRYELPVSDDTIIFIIKPQDWKTPVGENNLPRFYYIHKPAGSPELKYPGVEPTGPLPDSVDFPLYYEKEPTQYRAVIFGDPQARDQQELAYMAHDVIEELVGVDAQLGITLGDVVFNDLSLADSHNEIVSRIGIPWYNVMGNHDTNQDTIGDRYSDETFERTYGPSYYAFNYGDVHFIVLDNIQWGDGEYKGGFGDVQFEFMRNELAYVPPDKLIILLMHIPLAGMADRQELLSIIDDRKHTMSLSAHWHQQVHFFFDPATGWNGEGEHHHMICGTVCGPWWSGAPDEYGIPHATMVDGTPNGYFFITFDGNEYSIEYKAARAPASFQMNIYAPDEISAADAGDTDVIVNVFAGSDKSTVEMKLGEDGEWVPMRRMLMLDPYIRKIKEAEESDSPPPGRKLSRQDPTGHIWMKKLPRDPTPGVYVIYVRTIDMFGHEYDGKRIIRINEA